MNKGGNESRNERMKDEMRERRKGRRKKARTHVSPDKSNKSDSHAAEHDMILQKPLGNTPDSPDYPITPLRS